MLRSLELNLALSWQFGFGSQLGLLSIAVLLCSPDSSLVYHLTASANFSRMMPIISSEPLDDRLDLAALICKIEFCSIFFHGYFQVSEALLQSAMFLHSIWRCLVLVFECICNADWEALHIHNDSLCHCFLKIT